MWWSIFEMFCLSLEIAYCLYIPIAMLGLKPEVKPLFVLFYGILMEALGVLANNFISVQFSVVILYTVLYLIYNLLFIRGQFLEKLLWGYIPWILTGAVDVIVIIIFSVSFNKPTTEFEGRNWHRIIYVLVAKSIEILSVYCILSKKEKLKKINEIAIIPIICIPFCIVISCFELMIYSQPGKALYDPFRSILVAIILVLMIYAVGLFLNYLIKKENAQRLEIRLDEQTKCRKELIRTVRKIENETRQCLQKTWQVAKDNDIKNLEPIIDEFDKTNYIFKNVFSTGIEAIDIVLASKRLKAAEFTIGIEIDEINIESLDRDFTDVSSALYNALDYAIEQVRQIPEFDCFKVITVDLKQSSNSFELRLEFPIETDDTQVTTNASIYLINQIVERNHGAFFQTSAELFNKLEIKLPQ